MSLESLAAIFSVTPNDSRQLTLACARCLSQITATERSDRIVFVCAGGCTEDEVMGALSEVEPRFAGWWLNGGMVSHSHDSDEKGGDAHGGLEQRSDNARAAGLTAGGSAETQMPRLIVVGGAFVSNEEKENEHPEDSEAHLNGQARHVHYALAYARRGIRVFPCHEIESDRECSCGKLGCKSASKHPRIDNWQGLATTDENQIRAWWRQWPHANIGVACGMASNVTVLDVDVRHGVDGPGTLRELELEHGELPETPIVKTGSGGYQYYFAYDPVVLGRSRFAPGLDFRTEGNLVIGVGSVNDMGPYMWDPAFTLSDHLQPARLPPWLAALSPAGKKNGSEEPHDPMPPAKIEDMLRYVDPNDRDTWLHVGMALKNELGQSGRPLWDTYSKRSGKYDQTDQEKTWASIAVDGGITIGTLVKFAKDGGWGNGTSSETVPVNVLVVGGQREAKMENAIYLARPEVIEQLGYAQSIMLVIGGKHHGKTTNFRTLALSICRGLPVWGRATRQGPVLYMASDDELAISRNELLRMGWAPNDPLRFGQINPESDATPEQIIEEIGKQAKEMGAIAIMLDMLFDFAGIRDELSYAQTRSQVGLLQVLADQTSALVVCGHHTPKYLNEYHNASNAALGSQGISARFSPIVLTRKWAETLYTVESTTTRDPRGRELKPIKVVRNAQGWIEAAGEFKEYMKWEIYAARVLDLFENPQRGLSVFAVAEKLDVNRPKAQNTLKELENLGKLKREKSGRRYLYYLASTSMFDREGGQWES